MHIFGWYTIKITRELCIENINNPAFFDKHWTKIDVRFLNEICENCMSIEVLNVFQKHKYQVHPSHYMRILLMNKHIHSFGPPSQK